MCADSLTPLQVSATRLFFSLPESVGFAVAGGAALIARGLIQRPTRDVDLLLLDTSVSTVAAALDRRTRRALILLALQDPGTDTDLWKPTWAELAARGRCVQSKTTVRAPAKNTRSSAYRRTARASTRRSMSRPMATS